MRAIPILLYLSFLISLSFASAISDNGSPENGPQLKSRLLENLNRYAVSNREEDTDALEPLTNADNNEGTDQAVHAFGKREQPNVKVDLFGRMFSPSTTTTVQTPLIFPTFSTPPPLLSMTLPTPPSGSSILEGFMALFTTPTPPRALPTPPTPPSLSQVTITIPLPSGGDDQTSRHRVNVEQLRISPCITTTTKEEDKISGGDENRRPLKISPLMPGHRRRVHTDQSSETFKTKHLRPFHPPAPPREEDDTSKLSAYSRRLRAMANSHPSSNRWRQRNLESYSFSKSGEESSTAEAPTTTIVTAAPPLYLNTTTTQQPEEAAEAAEAAEADAIRQWRLRLYKMYKGRRGRAGTVHDGSVELSSINRRAMGVNSNRPTIANRPMYVPATQFSGAIIPEAVSNGRAANQQASPTLFQGDQIAAPLSYPSAPPTPPFMLSFSHSPPPPPLPQPQQQQPLTLLHEFDPAFTTTPIPALVPFTFPPPTPPIIITPSPPPPPQFPPLSFQQPTGQENPESYLRELENLPDDYNEVGEGQSPTSISTTITPINQHQRLETCPATIEKLKRCERDREREKERGQKMSALMEEQNELEAGAGAVGEGDDGGVAENMEMCNSDKLRALITEMIVPGDAEASKRAIQQRAEAEFGTYFNVICGSGFYSYIAHTDIFCLAQRGSLNCYVFSPVCSIQVGVGRRRRVLLGTGVSASAKAKRLGRERYYSAGRKRAYLNLN